MKRITTHHDGHGRTERILVLATDEPATQPAGNSSHHRYEFFLLPADHIALTAKSPEAAFDILRGSGWLAESSARIQFQRGPCDEMGSTPGVLLNAVLAALIDHVSGFQAGPLASRENALVITKLQEALFWSRERADQRAARGVLGTMAK